MVPPNDTSLESTAGNFDVPVSNGHCPCYQVGDMDMRLFFHESSPPLQPLSPKLGCHVPQVPCQQSIALSGSPAFLSKSGPAPVSGTGCGCKLPGGRGPSRPPPSGRTG